MLVPRLVEAWKGVPQGLKPSMDAGSCGTAEAVPFVERISFQDYPRVPFVRKLRAHLSTDSVGVRLRKTQI